MNGNEIRVSGTQAFMGKEIPVILGGFGEGQKAVLAKTISEIHEVETKYINKLINKNYRRFKEGVDIIDLKTGSPKAFVLQLGFTNAQWGNANNIYLLSERGYAKLNNAINTHCQSTLKQGIPHPQSPGRVIEVNVINEYDVMRFKDNRCVDMMKYNNRKRVF